ncbi:MAG TPA: hypothetical protein VL285_20005 [Bryobacteraceae bacterium]|jgi:hypothetical protein|nr:hypothetical protein [Bryobacteraceae bacterium]
MNSIQHVRVKIFAVEPVSIDLGEAIPVFHRWIQDHACPEMLIDVADYRHVPNGPGVMLIGHEANYSLDNTKGRLGLLYARKQAGGDAQKNLRQAYQAAVSACRRLEQEPAFAGKLVFEDGACEISINDRMLAPNRDETYLALRPEFDRFLADMWGPEGYAIERTGEPRELFRVMARRAG